MSRLFPSGGKSQSFPPHSFVFIGNRHTSDSYQSVRTLPPPMDKATKEFLDHARAVKLDSSERDEIKKNIVTFMQGESVTGDLDARLEEMSDVQHMIQRTNLTLTGPEKNAVRMKLVEFINQTDVPLFMPSFADRIREGFIAFFGSVIPRTAFIAVLCVTLGTGVAYAAEGSVPGDFLYGFKVYVMEPMTTSFIYSDSEQAEWETSRALRRLQEAEILASRNQLTDEAWNAIQGRFLTHIDHAKRYISSVGETDAERALRLSEQLESSLQSRSSSAITRFGSDDMGGTQLERVMRDVNAAATGLQQVRAGVEQRLEERIVEQQGEMQRESAQEVIDSATARIDALRTALSSQRGPSPARDKLVLAEATIGTARTQLNGGAFDLAQSSARDAAQYAQEGLALMQAE